MTDRTSRRKAATAPLFGRHAITRNDTSRGGSIRWTAAVMVIVAATGACYWSAQRQEQPPEINIPALPEPPKSDEIAALPPTTVPPAGTPPANLAVAPPSEEVDTPPAVAEPPADSLPPLPPGSGDIAAGPPKVEAPEPVEPPGDLASAPPTVDPPPPPQTVAPLPVPDPIPAQPEGHSSAVVWLSLSPDGKSFMSAGTDQRIKLWDFATRRFVRDVGVQDGMARSALFLPDGKRALTCGDDGTIVLRSVSDGSVIHVFSAKDHGGSNKLALSRDGNIAVSVHENGMVVAWDIERRAVLHVMGQHVWSISGVAISPDGERAVSGGIDGGLKLWNLETGKQLRAWLGHGRGTYGALYTPDGKQFITGSGDYTIKVWDGETAKLARQLDGHFGTVYALDISSDGKRLASASLDGTARLWDLETGEEIAQFSPGTGPLYSIAFGPKGTLITGGNDRAIRIWPADGGEEVAMIPGATE